MTLAIFDLDNTLIGGDSDHAWGQFLIENQFVDANTYQQQNDAFYDDYCNGTLDIIAYQEFALQPLSQYTPAQLKTMHEAFMAQKIAPMWLSKAEQLLESHRQQGHTLLIITATNRFITAPIAAKLGIEHLIATDAERTEDGAYTGRVEGIPSFSNGKITRLEQWLKEHNYSSDDMYFYSDSHNDLPLLEWVNKPYAVDPDSTLARIAKERDWPILSLR